MGQDLHMVEKVISKKLKNNQLLLAISIGISLAIILYKRENVYIYWSFYFLFIGALNLPNINKCKKDLIEYKSNLISSVTGRVLDVFPEKDESGNWIIFLDIQGEKDIKEFIVSVKPEVEIDNIAQIFHTNILKVPIKIEKIA